MSIIQDIFKPLYGKPCWQVEQGYGSFLTLEFGTPQLVIREPREAAPDAPDGVRYRAERRQAYVRGEWHLWLYLCNWKIFILGEEKAIHRSSRKVIQKATAGLNGEILVNMHVDETFTTTFEFDLGGKLICQPNRRKYGEDSDIWLLYEPSGYVFSLRTDGFYSHQPGNTAKNKEEYQPLFG